MLKKKEVRAFFTLLRTGLWAQPIDQAECFPLSESEWESLYDHAVRHTVEGLLFDALQTLDTQLLPPKGLLRKWVVRVEKIAQRNEKMDEVIKSQVKFFNNYNLHPILLKGRGVASIYPNPNRRSCGDIDWYFENQFDYKKATKFLERNEVKIQHGAGYSVNYSWNGFETDQHLRQFDIHNPFLKGYLQKLEKENASLQQLMLLDEVAIRLSAPILQSIQVNVHILKHLLSFGVGIRQLCDAARIYHCYSPTMDGLWLREVYRKLGVLKWIHVLHQVLVEHIGLSEDDLPFSVENSTHSTTVMQDIWQAGNFGFKDGYVYDVKNKKPVLRAHSTKTVIKRLFTYMPYAPMEAISFPLAQLTSRWFN